MFLLAIIPSRFQSTLQFWKLELLGSRDFRTSFLFAKDFFFPTTSGMKTTFTFFLGQDLACHKMNIIMPKGRWTHKSASKISDWTEQDLFSFLLRTFLLFWKWRFWKPALARNKWTSGNWESMPKTWEVLFATKSTKNDPLPIYFLAFDISQGLLSTTQLLVLKKTCQRYVLRCCYHPWAATP